VHKKKEGKTDREKTPSRRGGGLDDKKIWRFKRWLMFHLG
jgi:hypothetical protein